MDSVDGGLESIELDGLFGRKRIRIVLDSRRPTILTGANGTGKSTILRLVSALSNGDVVTLANAPVNQLVLNFQGLPSLRMTRNAERSSFDLKWGHHSGVIAASSLVQDLPEWAGQALEEHGYDIEATMERLSDIAGGSGVPYHEYTVAREALRSLVGEGPVASLPNWLTEFGDAFPVLFVSDQRLVTERVSKKRRVSGLRQRTSSLAVELAAYELAEQIDRAFSDYGRTSQQLDRRFPQEIIRAILKHEPMSPARLEELTRLVETKRESLAEVGLLEPDEYGPEISQIAIGDEENLRPVMHSVLAATLQKLRVFDELERRLTTFKNFLDNRFATKVLELSRADGMRFRTSSGQLIRPRQLSSGEQQMTVLAYEILFRAKPNTLVIVDEPELSLHVLWQDSLVNDLTTMGEVSGLQFLMATHSPTIIAEYPHLERALGGLAE